MYSLYSDVFEADERLSALFPKCTMTQSMRQPDVQTRQKTIMTCTGSKVNNAHNRKLAITVPPTNKKCRILLPPIEVVVIQCPLPRNPGAGSGSLRYPPL